MRLHIFYSVEVCIFVVFVVGVVTTYAKKKRIAFRRTKAIFVFYRGSRDMDTCGGFGGVLLGLKNCQFLAHISALKMKLKNPLGASESIHMRGLLPKNEPIRPRRLGCRWGCSVFEAFHLVFSSLL